jgi:hypothetical protein
MMSRREILLLLALVGVMTFTIGRWSSSAPVVASNTHAPSLSVQAVSSGWVEFTKGARKTITVECPSGFHVAGGGTYSPAQGIYVISSLPNRTAGWTGGFVAAYPGDAKVEAVCFKLNQ